MDPAYIHKLLLCIKYPYIPFQDATSGLSKYRIKLDDCFNAINKAIDFGFIHFQDFDLSQYEYYEKVQNGDISWIVPDKLIAFSGPTSNQDMGCPPSTYIPFFKMYKVRHVVRLNLPQYSDSKFTNVGIAVHDMHFSDGSVPSKNIVYKFLALCEDTDGPIAVHCKAGLGRTGCLIGSYLIKHYNMTSHEAIAWMRICRPGCVIGHQQAWLERMQYYLQRSGQLYRLRVHGDVEKLPKHNYGIFSVIAGKKLRASTVKSSNTFNAVSRTLVKVDDRRMKFRTHSTINKLGEKKKKKTGGKEKSDKNSSNTSDKVVPQQGDSLKRRKWENTMKSQNTVKIALKKSTGKITDVKSPILASGANVVTKIHKKT